MTLTLRLRSLDGEAAEEDYLEVGQVEFWGRRYLDD